MVKDPNVILGNIQLLDLERFMKTEEIFFIHKLNKCPLTLNMIKLSAREDEKECVWLVLPRKLGASIFFIVA